jgi:Flp pilus assembly protein CpaB
VLVALSSIPKGSVIERSELATAQVAMPSRLVGAEAMPTLSRVLGTSTLVAIRPGEIISTSLLASRHTQRPLRTISIGGLDPANLTASGIVPGARVDVVVTYGTGISATTQTVGTSIEVSTIMPESSGIGASQGDQVSLVIPTLIEGLAIAQASSAGKISLINSTGVTPSRTLPVYPPYTVNPATPG